ncbi:unnamed protein product, partial [Miscanthus lutarioriparius]
DFLWDGDFRLKWDPMLAHSKTLDEIPQNGATVPLDKKSFHSFAVTVLNTSLEDAYRNPDLLLCFK